MRTLLSFIHCVSEVDRGPELLTVALGEGYRHERRRSSMQMEYRAHWCRIKPMCSACSLAFSQKRGHNGGTYTLRDLERRTIMPSIPQTYTVSDFIEWQAKKQLVLAPEFQRGSVWSPSAKVFLIDTILNDLPIPQVYFRTKLNPQTQTTLREVVDGQQRLRLSSNLRRAISS